jgi:O-antigen/teichoic acid export membrane protein
MRLDSFAKNNILMFLASSIGSFFNLVYQLIMLRLLSAEAFASLNSLLSLLVIISVPVSAFNTMVTKHISSHHARNKFEDLRAIWQKLSTHTFLFGLTLLVLIFIFRNNIAHFLRIDSSRSIVILAGIFFLSALSSVISGGLQGLERFKWLALVTVAAGLLKLLISVGLLRQFPGSLEVALFGFWLPILISVLLGAWPLRFLFRGHSKEKIQLRSLYLYILPVLSSGICFALLTNIDMVLVKHFFTRDAQDYAIAQMIGKIILSISGVIYVVMFSRASNLHARKEGSLGILKRSLFFTFILSALAAIIYNIFPGLIFRALAGSVSRQAILLARVFSVSMLLYALSNVLFFYQLSIERYRFIRPLLIITSLQVIAMYLFHHTALHVASISLAGSLFILLFNLRSSLPAGRQG